MEKKIKKKESVWVTRFAYGGGDASCNIVMGMISTILTLFYTDYIGIHPVKIGLIMLISRVLDGAATLIMGFVAEKTNTKYGKYRPWILWTSVPYAVSIILLFTVPHSTSFAQIVYIFVTYNLCTTILYNTMNVPYGSLAYVMTRDADERDMLSIVRMVMASIGRLLAVCGTLPLVKLWGDGQAAWVKATVIWAVAAILLQLICFKRCEERVVIPARENQRKVSLAASMKSVLGNRYFWSGACFQTIQYVLFAVTGTSLTYYCKYVFGNDSWLYSALYFVEIVILIIVMLICPAVIRRYGKRNVAITGIIFALAGQLVFLFNPASLPMLVMSCVVRGIGFAPMNSVLFAFIGEAVEYGQWKTHLRQESLIYATSTVVMKIGAGISAAMITGFLSVAGYISAATGNVQVAQPDSAIDMIVNIYKYGPIMVLVICLITLLVYKLDKKLPAIMEELSGREEHGEL